MTIPTFKEAERSCINGSALALDKFIYDYEPAASQEAAKFREQLEAVLIANKKSNAKLQPNQSHKRRIVRKRYK